MSSPAAQAYANACTRERTDIAPEIIDALNMGDRECAPSNGRPLVDADLRCIAEALRMPHGLRCLSLEENAFGLDGVSAILDALSVNPGTLLELRLGKNKLKDPSVISIANTIMTTPLGLKVIDLGDNGITKLGCEALCNALVSKECSLIEVSLHSNQLEADSGIALAKAIRSAILKHLHLGYNQLRDAGATQLARCIPITSTLTTLDLTSNRIGPQGGQELARALMSATCTLQRINLRHNNFDNETIQLFSEVLLRNTSLTQLFLGFMNPSPETAAMVLTSLRQNRTLLLLDIYGWKLDLDTTGRVIEDVMFHNNVVRAITSDACQPIYHTIDKHNQERDSRGLHEIYIGPDDRHSAKAAFVKNSSSSRGASRSQQPGSSPQAQRVVSPQRGGSQQVQAQHPPARGPQDSQNNSMQARTASPQPAARGSQPSSVNNRQQSQQQSQQQQQQQQQQPRQVAVVQPAPSRGQQSPAQNSANSRQQPQPMQASDRQSSPNSRAASQSNRGAAAPAPQQQQQQPAVAQQQQLSRAAPQQAAQGASRAQPAASNGGNNNEDIKALIAQMQAKMDIQQRQHDAKIAELEKRIRALEEGKEDKKKGGANGGANSGMNTSRGGSPARVQPAASQQQQGGQQPARSQQSPMDRSHQSAVAPASQSQRGQPQQSAQQGAQGDVFDAQPQQQSARGQQSPMNRSQQGQSQNNQSQPQYQEVVSRSYQQPQQSQQQPPQRASSSGRGAGQQQQPTAASRAPLSAGGNQMQPFGAQRLGGSINNNNNSAPNSANNRSTPQHRPDQQAQQQQPQRAGAGRPQPYDGGMIKSSSPQPRDGSSMSPHVERRATSEAVMDVPEDMLIGQHPAQSPAQPNEPSNIAEGSLPAPDLQPSFHEAPNARMESKPNDWPMQLPRRKAPPRSDV